MRAHRVVIGLIAGLIFGSAIGALGGPIALRVAGILEPIGAMWVNGIRMTVVPLVVSLLFVSVATHESAGGMGRLTAATIATFLGLLVFAAVVALLLAPPLIADMKLAADAAERLRAAATASAGQTAAQVTRLPGFAAWVTSLVPVNAVKAAADGAMLPLIVFTVLFALASRRIEPALRDALVGFFAAIVGATTTIVEWIIFVAPIGVFALVSVAASRAGIALAGAMVYYILAISALLVLFALLMYPVASIMGRIPLGWLTRAVLPAQVVALGSSSSLASLPALVEGSRALGLPIPIGGFVLPFSVSTFKVATPIYWLLGILFLAKLYGIAVGTGVLLSVAFMSVVLSLTIPGVPQGAVLLLAPVAVQYGIPAEGVALLLAADTIPDLFATMTNVTGDFVAATVVARRVVAEVASPAASSADA
jgi:proton glutamate symport protein